MKNSLLDAYIARSVWVRLKSLTNTLIVSLDFYDSSEIIPWIRTFICRIVKMNFSNRSVENQFKKDLEAMYWMYDVKAEVSK